MSNRTIMMSIDRRVISRLALPKVRGAVGITIYVSATRDHNYFTPDVDYRDPPTVTFVRAMGWDFRPEHDQVELAKPALRGTNGVFGKFFNFNLSTVVRKPTPGSRYGNSNSHDERPAHLEALAIPNSRRDRD